MKYFYFLLFASVIVHGQTSCNQALPVSLGIYDVASYSGELPNVVCDFGNDNATQANWYVFRTDEDVMVKVSSDLSTNAYNVDTRLRIYTGSCDGLVCVVADDDGGNFGNGYMSTVNFEASANTNYYIVFDNRWNNYSFSFEISEFDPDEPVDQGNFSWVSVAIGNSSNSLAVDMNGDYLDDIVAVSSNSISIGYQQAEGGFVYETISVNGSFFPNYWSITAGDLNGDLRNDLLFGTTSGASVLLSDLESNSLSPINQSVFTQRTNMVDINNDGLLDVFICHDVAPNIYGINNGDGTFEWNQGGLGDFPTGGNYGSVWIDYDNDGDLDLFIAKCRGASDAKIDELHKNNGDGTFTNVAPQLGLNHPNQTWSSAWGDYDNDGDLDVFIGVSTNYYGDGGHLFKLNNGDGTFTDVTNTTVFATLGDGGHDNVTYDFDNDGNLDIYMENGGGTIFYNRGNLVFESYDVTLAGGAIADLNNDGFLDIYNYNSVLYNNGNENNWLKIATIGTRSNGNGIGARVEIHGDFGQKIREVRSGEGFSHGSSLNTHFGLGAYETIETLVVKWPSGIVDTYTDVPVNGLFFAVEGETLATQDINNAVELVVYPNPVKDVLYLKADVDFTSAFVYDASGKVMKMPIANNGIQVSALPNGMYFLKLVDTNGIVYAKKFIVKK